MNLSRREWMAMAGAAAGGQAQAAGRRPNIILIVADDLGYGDLGCYGNRNIRTPHLDRMAEEGVRFTDFTVSWPACTPSRSSILTGRCPQRNGLYDMIRNNEVNWKYQFTESDYATSPEMTLGMDLREVTIGQALKAAGYATGLVGKWDSGRARRFLPPQRGFDFFYGFANTGIDYYTHERYGIASMYRGNERIKEEGHATDLFHREARRFVGEHKDRPFFLYLAYNAPHIASTFDKTASQVPEKYWRMYGDSGSNRKAQRPALITQMDDAVGDLFAQLRELGIDDNTAVLFMSDNGGDMPGSNGPLRGAKAQLWEGGLRVPLLARWPGRFSKGTVRADFGSSVDLFPTFLEIAGAAPPRGVKLDGLSLLPALTGRGASRRKEFFWQYREEKAARAGKWKWIESRRGGGLFDLTADIGETRDLSAERPDVAADLKARWAGWRKEMDEAEPRGPFRDY